MITEQTNVEIRSAARNSRRSVLATVWTALGIVASIVSAAYWMGQKVWDGSKYVNGLNTTVTTLNTTVNTHTEQLKKLAPEVHSAASDAAYTRRHMDMLEARLAHEHPE